MKNISKQIDKEFFIPDHLRWSKAIMTYVELSTSIDNVIGIPVLEEIIIERNNGFIRCFTGLRTK